MPIQNKVVQIAVCHPDSFYALTDRGEIFLCVLTDCVNGYKWRPISLELESPEPFKVSEQLSFNFNKGE